MTDHTQKPTTAKTILCKHCGHSIRRELFHHQPSPSRWLHNWTGKRGCVGKATEAEPQETR